MEVAISIIGSAVTSSELRNNASRVAFPPTNCAVTDAAQHMAMRVERALDVMTWLLTNASYRRESRNRRRLPLDSKGAGR
jgi:hypothetical protein